MMMTCHHVSPPGPSTAAHTQRGRGRRRTGSRLPAARRAMLRGGGARATLRALQLLEASAAALPHAAPSRARGFAASAGCARARARRARSRVFSRVHPAPPSQPLTWPRARRRRSGGGSRLSALLLLVPSAVAAGLGVWQLQRREWKVEVLAARTRQLSADPLPLASLAAPGARPAEEWRRVVCKGELQHAAASYVRAASGCAHTRAADAALGPLTAVRAAPPQVGPRVRTVGGTARSGFLLVRCGAARGRSRAADAAPTLCSAALRRLSRCAPRTAAAPCC
jgi:hypothetical protein